MQRRLNWAWAYENKNRKGFTDHQRTGAALARSSIFDLRKEKVNNVCVRAIARLAVYKFNYIDGEEVAWQYAF